jgi:hypothetical protein
MKTLLSAAAGLLLAGLGTASAQAPVTGLAAQAVALVPMLERVTSMPMVVLERTGDDPGQFWYKAMQALCAKTGDNWCEEDLTSLTDTTNLLGWSRVMTYRPRDSKGNQGIEGGITKSVCVILPPKPGVSAGFTAIGLSGGGAYLTEELPSDEEAEAFLYLTHAASCMSTGGDQAAETRRSDAFAALALTLLEGNPNFVSGRAASPGRMFSAYRSGEAVRWSVSVGERVLLDLWKRKTVALLQAGGCSATLADSTEMDTQSIPRAGSLPQDGDCRGNRNWSRQGSVSDGNLWLWGGVGIPLPPEPYTPFMSFGSVEEGVRYAWTTAGSIAKQR